MKGARLLPGACLINYEGGCVSYMIVHQKQPSLLCSQPSQLWWGHGRRQGRASMVAAKVFNVWEKKQEWQR
jgi:hypothetical protein